MSEKIAGEKELALVLAVECWTHVWVSEGIHRVAIDVHCCWLLLGARVLRLATLWVG